MFSIFKRIGRLEREKGFEFAVGEFGIGEGIRE